MKTWLQYIGLFAIGAVIGVFLPSLLQWRGCGPKPEADTVVVMVPVKPPAVVVTPNPAHAIMESDRDLLRRVDSLVAAQARERIRGLAREDSLMVFVAYQDSLLRVRSRPTRSEQRIDASDPTGIRVTGDLKIMHEPLTMTDLTRLTLDSVQVPVKIVHEKEVVTEFNPYLVIGAVVVGAAIGGYLMHKVDK